MQREEDDKTLGSDQNPQIEADEDEPPPLEEPLFYPTIDAARYYLEEGQFEKISQFSDEAVLAISRAKDPSHDKFHLWRVFCNVVTIWKREQADELSKFRGCDLFVCLMGALAHDWLDRKVVFATPPYDAILRICTDSREEAEQEAFQKAEESLSNVLKKCEVSEEVSKKVFAIAKGIGFKKRFAQPPCIWRPIDVSDFPEFFIVEDADFLDAIGPIGYARACMCAAKMGHALYDETTRQDPLRLCSARKDTVVGHYDEKIFNLPHLLNTRAASSLAQPLERWDRVMIQTLYGALWSSLPQSIRPTFQTCSLPYALHANSLESESQTQ